MKTTVSGCPIEDAMRLLSGRWRTLLVYYLIDGKKRFAQLRRDNPRISHRILTHELRALESAGVITRIRKGSEYRQVEFARRQPVQMHGVKTWIVSREDLILSKLVWAKDSGSELQRRDVQTLLDESMDRAYLERWAPRLGVAEALAEISA